MRKTNLVLLAALMTVNGIAVAGVNITPSVGYHHAGKSWNEQRAVFKDANNERHAKGNGEAYALAIGVELTPAISAEVEYLHADHHETNYKNHERSNGLALDDVKQNNMSANLVISSDIITQNYQSPLKAYALAGLGLANYEVVSNSGVSLVEKDYMVANLGLGAKYRFNDMIALKSEIRGIINQEKWVEGLASAGLQFTLGGHLRPPAPKAMPAVQPMVVKPKTVVVKRQPKDSDKDGVMDARDRCPNTKAGSKVNSVGCTLVQKIELRVFFDTNKSNIKQRYNSEIAKVASIMRKNKQVTTVIEGHTSKTGSRKVNEKLAISRANAVKSKLVSQYGINPARMAVKSFAWDRPIAPNTTPEGRALNRRVYATFKFK